MDAILEKQKALEAKARKKQLKAEQKELTRIAKRKKRASLKSYPTVSFTKNAVIYLCFFMFALLFTQALRSTLSSVLFIFAMLFPVIEVLYALSGLLFVSEANTVEAETVQKGSPLPYEIMIANNGFLPYPFVDADVRYPSGDGVHCDIKRVSCSLAPMGTFRIRDTAVFHYRGGYEIGIRDLYVYDTLKMIRIRMRRNNLRPVFVMPRRPVIVTEGEGAASEVNTTEVRNMRGTDRTELTEIKEYRMGDGLRDIHWKLSSKTQDLMVKHYGMNACRSICFLPDLGENYTDPLKKGLYAEDINLCAADAVIEMTIALMLAALRGANNVCSLLWYDRRAAVTAGEMGYAAEVMYNELDFERVYPYFGTADLHADTLSPASLCRFFTESEGTSYYIVTSRLDAALIEELQQSMGDYSTVVLNGGMHVYYYEPADKILDPDTRAAHMEETEQLVARMRAVGIQVVIFDSVEMFREIIGGI